MDTHIHSSCPSDYALDQYVAGDAGGEAAQQVQAHLSLCLTCRHAYERRRAAVDTFAHWQPRARSRAPRRWGWTTWGASAAAVLLVWVFARTRTPESALTITSEEPPEAQPDPVVPVPSARAVDSHPSPRPTAPVPSERIKGQPHLGVLIQRSNGGAQPWHPGELIAPGEHLDFLYSSPTPAYLTLVAVDPQGEPAVLFDAGAAEPLPAGSSRPLGLGADVDEVPGEERIDAYFCASYLTSEGALTSWRAGTPPPGCTVESLIFMKAPSQKKK